MSPQPELRAVDRIEVQVLVDNVTDNLSTLPAGADITHEWAYLIREGLVSEISGDNTCCACHGLALVVTVRTGDDAHTVLFDGGPAGYAVKRNGERLATDFGHIDTIVLSHGHWDHAGGLLAALELIRDAGGGEGREIPFHVHPGRARASKRPEARPVPGHPRTGHTRPQRSVGGELDRGAAHPRRALLRERRDPPRHLLRDRIRRPHVTFRRREVGARPPDHGRAIPSR